jgi:hypothetical protein
VVLGIAKEWWNVDVITIAAPNLRINPSNRYNPCSGNKKANISNDELYNEIFEIMMYELKIYADNFSNDNPEANNFIHNHIANYIQMLFDKKMK